VQSRASQLDKPLFGDPSVPFQSTTTSSLPLTSLTNTLFSIGEQWNFYFATDPRLKLHGLYYHKLLSHPAPTSLKARPDPLLLDSRDRRRRLLDYSTPLAAPPKTTTRRTPISSRFFTFSRRPTLTAIFPCHCATIPFHSAANTRQTHVDPLTSLPFPFPSPSLPRALPCL
jgi:hypothetical protein